MGTYKITNITNLLGKRDYKYNSTLDVDYVDGLIKKKIKIKAGESVNLTIDNLPLSVHRLRVKNFIIVNEIEKVVEVKQKKKKVVTSKPKVKSKKESTKKTTTTSTKKGTSYSKKKSDTKDYDDESESFSS